MACCKTTYGQAAAAQRRSASGFSKGAAAPRQHHAARLPEAPVVLRTLSSTRMIPNTAVWARVDGMPHWPALVLSLAQANKKLDEGAKLQSPAQGTTIVQFFDEERTISVVTSSILKEYTKNMSFVRRGRGYVHDIVLACYRANRFIHQSGHDEQRKRVQADGFLTSQLCMSKIDCKLALSLFKQHGVYLANSTVAKRLQEHTEKTVPPLRAGLVCFAAMSGYCAWPGVIIERRWAEIWCSGMDDKNKETALGKHEVFVDFFNDSDFIYPVHESKIVEYTANMSKLDEAGDSKEAVYKACIEANTWISKNGTLFQRKKISEPGFFDSHKPPKTTAVQEEGDDVVMAVKQESDKDDVRAAEREGHEDAVTAAQQEGDDEAPFPDVEAEHFSPLVMEDPQMENLSMPDLPMPNLEMEHPADDLPADDNLWATDAIERAPNTANEQNISESVPDQGEPSGRGDIAHDVDAFAEEDIRPVEEYVPLSQSSRGSSERRGKQEVEPFGTDEGQLPHSYSNASPGGRNGNTAQKEKKPATSRGRSAANIPSQSTGARGQMGINRQKPSVARSSAGTNGASGTRTSRPSPSRANGSASEAVRPNGGRGTPSDLGVSFRASSFKAHLQKLEASKGVVSIELEEIQLHIDDVQRQIDEGQVNIDAHQALIDGLAASQERLAASRDRFAASRKRLASEVLDIDHSIAMLKTMADVEGAREVTKFVGESRGQPKGTLKKHAHKKARYEPASKRKRTAEVEEEVLDGS